MGTWIAALTDRTWLVSEDSLVTRNDLSKMAADTLQLAMDFGDQPELNQGQTITGTPTASVSPSGPTISAVALNSNGYQVNLTAAGGTAGTDYTVTVTVVLSGGSTLARTGILHVL